MGSHALCVLFTLLMLDALRDCQYLHRPQLGHSQTVQSMSELLALGSKLLPSLLEQALTQVSLLTPKGGPRFTQLIFSHLILFPLPSSLSPPPSPVLFPPPLIPLLPTFSPAFLLLFQDKEGLVTQP